MDNHRFFFVNVFRRLVCAFYFVIVPIRHFYPQSELLIADNWLRIKF